MNTETEEKKTAQIRLPSNVRARLERLAIASEQDFVGMSFNEAGQALSDKLYDDSEGEWRCTVPQAVLVLKRYNVPCVNERTAKAQQAEMLLKLTEENAWLKTELQAKSETIHTLETRLGVAAQHG